MMCDKNCCSCGQDIATVAATHEATGHNVRCELRYDLVQDDKICEDCRDDILENMK